MTGPFRLELAGATICSSGHAQRKWRIQEVLVQHEKLLELNSIATSKDAHWHFEKSLGNSMTISYLFRELL